MIRFMSMKRRVRISKGGQISVPAPVRHRWGTSTVVLDDQGERLVIEPAPDDPIEAAAGALAEYFEGVNVQDLRDEWRREEQEIEEGKHRRHSWSS
jgi:bifunctional DNA-binding transcriptional regulator/antitoxin component of YhaV-PrlF toxin-antitoxin module